MREISEKEKIELRENLRNLFENKKLEELSIFYSDKPESKDTGNWYYDALTFMQALSIESINSMNIDNVTAQMISLLDLEVKMLNRYK